MCGASFSECLFTCKMFFAALITAFTFLAFIIVYFKRRYGYWKGIGVEQLDPKLVVGDFYDLLVQKLPIGEKIAEMYRAFKSKGQRFGGVYFGINPMLVPIDPEIIKSMLQKDSHHFLDRGMYHNEEHDPLAAHLFNIEGDRWRFMRTKLSPTFTSGKMKGMFHIVAECGEKLNKFVGSRHTESEPVDIKEILACFSTDVIASCAFGIECDSLNNPKEEFRKYGRIFFTNTVMKGVKTAMSTVSPGILKMFNVVITERDVTKYFMGIIRNNLDYRRANRVDRPDFFNLLIQLGKKAEGGGKLDDASGLSFNEMAAQAFVFFLGGFETSSTVMTFALYELSRNMQMQKQLRQEITTVLAKYDGKICYEALSEMPYLEGVINESMRVYPPLPLLNRICTQDYQIPGSDVTIQKGVQVLISVKGLHMDPEHFPNPEAFEPERFAKSTSPPPFVFLPFGDGPRICIGMRFGLMQTKIGLISLIRDFEITYNPKTKPMTLNPQAFVTASTDEIYLDFKRLRA